MGGRSSRGQKSLQLCEGQEVLHPMRFRSQGCCSPGQTSQQGQLHVARKSAREGGGSQEESIPMWEGARPPPPEVSYPPRHCWRLDLSVGKLPSLPCIVEGWGPE